MKKIIICLVLTIPFITLSQETGKEDQNTFNQFLNNLFGSFESNAQWYLNDTETGEFPEDEHVRANSYLKLDYNFLDNFSVGIQAESYAPEPLLNYSPNFDENINVAQYYAKYRNNKIDITLGYFYEQFGSGLILRAWEDRALGMNNSIRGGRINYRPSNTFNITAFWGEPRVGFEVSDSQLFGANAEVDFGKLFNIENITNFNIGLSYVGKKENYESENDNHGVPELVNSFSGRLDLDFGKVYSNFEYILKGEDARLNDAEEVVEGKTFKGNALLWTLGYSKKGLGISGTFRRLEGMNFYAERTSAGSSNLYAEQVINYLPALTKQHDYTLSNIYVYQSQPGLNFIVNQVQAGEIGTQFDLYYKIQKGTKIGGKYGVKLTANVSYWAGLGAKAIDPEGSEFSFSDNADYEADFLSFKEKYYRDINFEIRKKWSPKVSSIFSYMNIVIDKDLALGKPLGISDGFIHSDIVVLESTYKFGQGNSFRLEAQHLFNKDDAKNWVGGTAEYFFNSNFGIYANDSYNYQESDNDENTKIHFYNVGGSFTKGATRVALNYGRQRGGLLCVGGVCRIVSPNTGFTLNLTTSF